MGIAIKRCTLLAMASIGTLACIAMCTAPANAATATSSSFREIGVSLHVQSGGYATKDGDTAATVDVFRGVRITTTNGKTTVFTGAEICIDANFSPPPGYVFGYYHGCSKVPDSHIALLGLPPKSLTISPSQVVLERCVSPDYTTINCSSYRTVTLRLRVTGLTFEGPHRYNNKQVADGCTYIDGANQLQYSNFASNSATNPYVVLDGQVLDSSYEDQATLEIGSVFTSAQCIA